MVLGAIKNWILTQYANILFKHYNFKKTGKNITWKLGQITHSQNISIGDNVYIGPNNKLNGYGGIEIQEGTIIAPRITIHSSNHNYENAEMVPYDGKIVCKKVSIGKNCWIGENVMINPGVTIGEGCIIAMGSVVVKDVAAFSIMGGNPAKLIKKRSDTKNYTKVSNFNYLQAKKEGKVVHKNIIKK